MYLIHVDDDIFDDNVFDPILKAIKEDSAHCSILDIKEKMNNNVFSFRNVTYEEILNEIISLDTSKSIQSEDIPFIDALSGLRQFSVAEIPLKMMQNAFYFTSKALFVLKIFKFFS